MRKQDEKKFTRELWHVGTLAFDAPTYEFCVPTESLDDAPIIDIACYERSSMTGGEIRRFELRRTSRRNFLFRSVNQGISWFALFALGNAFRP